MAEKRITRRHVIARLVTEAVHISDTAYWAVLTEERTTVEDYFRQMGVHLVVDETAGLGYLRPSTSEEEDAELVTGEAPLPKVIRSQPLGYLPSLLAALLRERLAIHEQSSDGISPLLLDDREFLALLRPHLKEDDDEKALMRRIRDAVVRLDEIGVVRKQNNRGENLYRVEPIIKARIPVHQLQALLEQIKAAAAADEKPEVAEGETP